VYDVIINIVYILHESTMTLMCYVYRLVVIELLIELDNETV